MALDLTSFEFATKQYYTDARVREMVYKDAPLHALLPKFENAGGENIPTPLLYGNPQSRSATFSVALALSTSSSSKGVKFLVTRTHDYAIATVDNETMLATQSDKGAFMAAAVTEFDGALNALARSLHIAEYGNGSGVIGRVDAEPSENVGSFQIQLDDPESVTNFEVGQVLNIWSAESGGSQRNADGSTTDLSISGVDRDEGILTISNTYSSSGTIAAGDYIFCKGDRGLKVKGLAAWLPATAPTSGDSFFGVDRSADVTRLAGIRYDGRNMPIEDALVQGVRRAEREGAKISHIMVNYRRWAELEISLGSKVVYVDVASEAGVGFRGIRIQGSKGFINVIADFNCPDNVAYALQMDTWQLLSLGRAVDFITTDGNKILRQSAADGVEARMGYYAQLRCFAPGFNCRIQLS